MLSRLWYYLLGHVIIELEGGAPERFINLATRQGLVLWDLSVHKGRYRLACGLSAFHTLRPMRRASGATVRIISKHGLPFLCRRMRRRKGWVGGLALAVVALYAATSFVWFVEIQGTERLPDSQVRQELAVYGLRPGVWKGALDFRGIAWRLPVDHDEIVWASVQVRGTKVTVEVVERRRAPPEEVSGPADVVAARPAVVDEVLVLKGTALVAPGDRVVPGDVLVTGALRVPIPRDDPADEPRYRISGWVEARARIMGRVWYEEYVETPRREEQIVATGRSFTGYRLVVAGRPVPLTPDQAIIYDEYQVQVRTMGPQDLGLDQLPVRLEALQYREIVRHQLEVPPPLAQRRARQQLLDRVQAGLGEGRVVATRSEQLQGTDQMLGLRITVETVEEIGQIEAVDWSGADSVE